MEPKCLSAAQRRVIGVLVEKAFTTPENYPLTINALVTGCNQKNNRYPSSNYQLADIENVLDVLITQSLLIRVYPATGRVERWKHNIKDIWDMDRPRRAIIAELLLRGMQSEGELRTRASRMVDIPSLDELRKHLSELSELGFVQRLSPEGRKRGVIWDHCLYMENELERNRKRFEDEFGDSQSETENVKAPEKAKIEIKPEKVVETSSKAIQEIPETQNEQLNQSTSASNDELLKLVRRIDTLDETVQKISEKFELTVPDQDRQSLNKLSDLIETVDHLTGKVDTLTQQLEEAHQKIDSLKSLLESASN